MGKSASPLHKNSRKKTAGSFGNVILILKYMPLMQMYLKQRLYEA